MSTIFADSYYYLAMINDRDEGHVMAVEFAKSFRGQTLTTEWVLTEVGDALAGPQRRPAFLGLLQRVGNNPNVTIIEASHQLFVQGIDLYAQRPDKEWSLTDCISFVVMEEHGVREVLTGDHHFEQAGFVALLR
jgi:predicted nucleic acid-binding protein